MQDDSLLAGGATEESGVRSKKPPVKVDGEVDVTPRDEVPTRPPPPQSIEIILKAPTETKSKFKSSKNPC